MIEKYKYRIENQIIITNDLKSLPNGIDYNVIYENDIIDNSELDLILKNEQKFKDLEKTDWYITRFVETGEPIPSEILKERELIRNK